MAGNDIRQVYAVAVTALVAALGLAWGLWFASSNRSGWGVDFNEFYAAGRLAGTGHLYDWDALRNVERAHGNGIEVPTARLPVVAYGFKVLTVFPYDTSHWIWFSIGLAALAGVAAIWPSASRPGMFLALVWSIPAVFILLFGQDVPLWLWFFATGLVLLGRNRPWAAGVAFSLCICKYHLAVAVPLMLVARKSWKTLLAAAAVGSVLLAASFAIEGPHWPHQYLEILRLPSLSPEPTCMPSLHGLSAWLPWGGAVEAVLAAGAVLLLWAALRKSASLGMAGALTAATGVLLGRHVYAGDCVLLVPLSVLILQRESNPTWLKLWAGLALSPIPFLLLMFGQPYQGQAIIVGFVIAALIGIRESTKSVGPPAAVASATQKAHP